MFGFTVRALETKKEYTVEELYEAIKDQAFAAGEPRYYKDGLVQLIIFPELDRFNQVRIAPAQIKKAPYSKFTICKRDKVGIGAKVQTHLLSRATRGLAGLFSYVGRNVYKAEQQVISVYEVLQTLDL